MSKQAFGPKFDSAIRLGCFSAALLIVLTIALLTEFVGSPWVTSEDLYIEQPVPFSHKHHAGELQIDCRYCHSSVETSDSANFPPTETCMTCHSMLYTDAEMLKPIRESYSQGHPVPWIRVAKVPDFVYFSHQVHVNNGVSCTECHGRVDQMPLTYKENDLVVGRENSSRSYRASILRGVRSTLVSRLILQLFSTPNHLVEKTPN